LHNEFTTRPALKRPLPTSTQERFCASARPGGLPLSAPRS